ncbi:MAG: aminotransferase [Bacteroidia bacterium]|nr:aminotransferase [Bacteroidia bacterium]
MTGMIIQARMGSTRLAEKMLRPFFNGKGIFETLLLRIKNAGLTLPVVVATTTNSDDDILQKIAQHHEIPVFRGSGQDVLDRFIRAGEHYQLEKIIRVCADNPLLDLTALKKQADAFLSSGADYWCYALSDKTPTIKTHYGFWAEGVTLAALQKTAQATQETQYHEHVTNYIYTHPTRFTMHYETIDSPLEQEKNMRFTVDTENDFLTVQKVFAGLYNNKTAITASAAIAYSKKYPEIIKRMQKEISNNKK